MSAGGHRLLPREAERTVESMVRKLFILLVVASWALMTGLFVQKHYLSRRMPEGEQGRSLLDPEYRMGIYYGRERIGEFQFRCYPWSDEVGRGFRLSSSLHLSYPPVGEAHITGDSFTDEHLVLRRFEYYLNCRLNMLEEQQGRLQGKVEKGTLSLQLTWGSFARSFEMPAPGNISLYDPITPWIVGEKFHLGQEYSVEVLNRFTRRPQVATIRVLRRKTIPFQGREVSGYEVETVVEDLKSLFWIGEDGRMYRMESPLGFSLVREPLSSPQEDRP